MYQIRFQEVRDVLNVAVIDRRQYCGNYFKKGKSFLPLDGEEGEIHSYEEIVSSAIGVPKEFFDDAGEIIGSIAESLDDDMSVAFAYAAGVLYVRIFDGEKYVFPLPILLTDNADAEMACIALAEYSTREMVPLVITDIPRDELDFLCSVFPHVDACSYSDDEDCFYIKVNNECDMLDDVPTLEMDGITLGELTDADRDRYAQLCRDRDLNKYWGYDADEDNPDGDTDFYLDTARREFHSGVALTLAVREGGELVGEATVYGFDYRGTASIAVRVMRDCHGRGIGSRATRALIEVARQMGLSTLLAQILEENVASIKMTSKYMVLQKYSDGKAMFTLDL